MDASADRLGACPSCGGPWEQGAPLYRASGVPVHSCLLSTDAARARAIPRGEIQLRRCAGCGFVSNVSFDPGALSYDDAYEESQGCSPTFTRFAESLIDELVESHAVRARRVLEVGCGKGEFLTRLCAKGANFGIGIDPAYVPGRNPEEANADVEFVRELVRPDHLRDPADVLVCRHTLEHIADVGAFLRLIRTGVCDGGLVVIEVPDWGRIERQAAFWDVYYEHCSYFTMESLARTCRACGIEPVDLRLEFAGQYVVLIGRAGVPIEAIPHARETSASAFQERVGESVERWRRTILAEVDRGGRVALWGSGSKGVAFLSALDLGDALTHVVDINPYRHARFLPGSGVEILPPEALAVVRPSLVIAMNPVYLDEIRADLGAMGVPGALTALDA